MSHIITPPPERGPRPHTLRRFGRAVLGALGALGALVTVGASPAHAVPVLSTLTNSINFPTQLMGTTSLPQSVLVSNTGTTPLTVSAATVAGPNASDFTATNGCTAPVAVNGTCLVSVTLRPAGMGNTSATLTIVSDGGTALIPMTGTAISAQPVLAVNPAVVTFAAREVGVGGAAQNISVSNTGSAGLTISAVTVSGPNPADFAAASTCPPLIAAGATCAVAVTFTPTAAGTRSAIVTIASNGGIAAVSTNGTAVSPVPAVSVAPASLTFAPQTMGRTSPSQTVTVSNPGPLPLLVSSVAAAGANAADFAVTNGCTAAVAATASCTITVRQTPQAVGSRTASLAITSDRGSLSVPLAGSGTIAGTCPATVTGWYGQYWSNTTLAGTPTVCRNDAAVNFDFGSARPAPGVTDTFSARWTRADTFLAGTYTFTASMSDGVRLYVDGAIQIDAWVAGTRTTRTAKVAMSPGTHTVVLEFVKFGSTAAVSLGWTRIATSVCPTITGWKGEYFDNANLVGGAVLCRNDAAVNFNWGSGSPGAPLPSNNFSVRWSKLQAFAGGTYTFTGTSNDGMRVYVDGVLRIDSWFDAATARTRTASVSLTAGNHLVVVEYYERSGSALVSLSWSPRA